MFPAGRLHLKKLFLWAAPLAGLACGGDGGAGIVLPSMRITTSTQGVELDSDGYTVAVDGSAAQTIGADASLIVDPLPDGQHTVTLAGLAANCSAPDNPRTVTVSAGVTTTVAFAVTCGATSGTIAVTTTTTGAGSDPDGFSVTLDGADRGSIGMNATVSLTDVTATAHLVGLTGLAANCQISGDNPRSVTVVPDETAQMTFAVTCTAPAPNSGTLQITTTTGGSNLDADGYSVSVEGAASQPIAVNATLSIPNVSVGPHAVQLLGLATNCTVAGANPRQATVPAAGTVTVAFEIACVPPPAGTGRVQVTTATTGSSMDTDGYTVTLDGGSAQAITVNGTRAFDNLAPGPHSVQLSGVAAECTVSGDNPRTVTVTAGLTATVAFTITCTTPPPGTGSASITAATTGSALDPDGYTVMVQGSAPQSLTINGSVTVGSLSLGAHSVQLSGVATNCTVAGSNPRTVTIAAGQTATVAFTITCVAVAPSVNLSIPQMYLTQSTQTLAGTVPLVAGRNGFLRVFVVANQSSNTATPTVRVRFLNGSSITTRTINAPGTSTPNTVHEGTLGSSWNLPVEAALIQPGLSIEATVDPGSSIAESNEGDNQNTKSFTVQSVPSAAIRFVRVLQAANNLQGTVSNTDQLIDLARRMHPLNAVQTDIRSTVFTVNGPLLPNDDASWNQALSDFEGARTADPDGSSWTYFGIVKLNYGRQDGLVGLAFQGFPVALGWDDPADASRVVAHELGHTWGRRHSPCGNPPPLTIDGLYPSTGSYSGGRIGVFGFDVTGGSLKAQSLPDIMGYCVDPAPWISDYTYRAVMAFRQANPVGSVVASAAPQPSLLVWGQIVNGRPVLEPAFQVVTQPSLPRQPGPYSVTGTAADGSQLFSLSFDATRVADEPQGNGHFAFAVPLDQRRASQLAAVRLSGPGAMVVNTGTAASLRAGAAGPGVTARREGESVVLQWNALVHPTIMVRDPDTGSVLSFARGGNARVWTSKGELDLELSDGVKSQRLRVAISRS